MDSLEYTCKHCGGNEILFDVEETKTYRVILEDYGDISLEEEPHTGREDSAEPEGRWYCGECFRDIFVGTKDQFMEYLEAGRQSNG